MENKKVFNMYIDQKGIFNKLPDEKAGQLIKHIFAYVNDENPQTDDLIIDIAFEPIKQQLKRDLIKRKEKCEKNSFNGKKGGRPIKDFENSQKANGYFENPTKPKKADTDKDTDTDKDIYKNKQIHFGFDDEIENLIKEYNKQRKKKLEKLTEAGIELFKKKLQKLGGTHKGMIAVLEQSIVNGWEGLFELKSPIIDYEDIETFGREMRKDYEGTKAKVGKQKFFELKSKWIEYNALNNN